jgi:ParB family chromosome partitioning protein
VPDSAPDPLSPQTAGRGIGRGLAAILPGSGNGEPHFRADVALELIRPNPRQPRRTFDEDALLALAESIRSRGVLQPVVVRPLAGGHFELVAGERRVRAAKVAGLQAIPAILRDAAEDERLELALAENVAREDLNPIEEARACATLVEDLGLTKGELGRRIGRSRVAVSNLIRLLDLPEAVLDAIEAGALSEGHGRALLLVKDHAARSRLADDARENGWSVRETERRAREAETAEPERTRGKPEIHPDLADALAAAEDTLTAALGQPVKVKPSRDGCKAELEFETPAEAVHLAEKLMRNRGESDLTEAA